MTLFHTTGKQVKTALQTTQETDVSFVFIFFKGTLYGTKVHLFFKPLKDEGGRTHKKIYIQLLGSFCALSLLSLFDTDKEEGFR